MTLPRVVVLRGHLANPWELGTWELLADRFDVTVAVTGSNRYDVSSLRLSRAPIRAMRDRLPRGRVGDFATLVVGDRYVNLEQVLEGADIVHGAELGVWFSGQPAELRRRLGYKLVLTVWETIPFLDTYRRQRGRRYRRVAIDEADLLLAATDRARRCLELEGVDPNRIVVSPPGIDVERFRTAPRPAAAPPPLVVSPGRLVWEKGHFDVLRALAAADVDARLLIVGAGPERDRLLRYASELGLADRVTIEAVPYEGMPAVFAAASCVVLGSLAIPFWEEQFGMVLAEAMAAGVPVIASSSGAIPEVLAGSGAQLFTPGDWPTLAARLAEQLRSPGSGAAASYPAEIVERYSTAAAAVRLAAAYQRVLNGP